MTSEWVDKYEIMRDLSMVQGCVPVDVSCTVMADEKPPSQDIIEETEEEFYPKWAGGDVELTTPDLGLIQRMLDVVRECNVGSDSEPEQEPEDIIEITKISKLNPNSKEFKPKMLSGGDTVETKIDNNKIVIDNKNDKIKVAPKARKQRNMAIESLLFNLQNKTEENIENITISNGYDNIKLSKPNDFISKPEPPKENVTKSVQKVDSPDTLDIVQKPEPSKEIQTKTEQKVTDWLETQLNVRKTVKKKTPTLVLDTSFMFKKKEITQKKTVGNSPPSREASNTPTSAYKEYVPSSNAAEYYKKFLECSMIKQCLQDDVWTRAEKQMEEIDIRRKEEAELFALSLALSKSTVESQSSQSASQSTSFDPDDQKLDVVRLPQHRHSLTAPCIVCAVKNKETINTEQPENWRAGNNSDNIVTEHVRSWIRLIDDSESDNNVTDDASTSQSNNNDTENDTSDENKNSTYDILKDTVENLDFEGFDDGIKFSKSKTSSAIDVAEENEKIGDKDDVNNSVKKDSSETTDDTIETDDEDSSSDDDGGDDDDDDEKTVLCKEHLDELESLSEDST